MTEHQKFETPMTKSKVSQSTHKSLKKGEERTLANVSEKEAKHKANPKNAHKSWYTTHYVKNQKDKTVIGKNVIDNSIA